MRKIEGLTGWVDTFCYACIGAQAWKGGVGSACV